MRLFSLLVATLLLSTCSSPALGELQGFQQALQSRFHVARPGVELRNNNLLLIAFEDSQFTGMDSKALLGHARAVAEFVRDSFPSFARLSTITIGYVAVSGTGRMAKRTIYGVQSYSAQDLAPVPARFQ
jgi:hypothetical protein